MKPLEDWTYLPSQRLGGGGYSDVYRCHRPEEPDTHCAIKVLKNPKYLKTLERELKALNTMRGCPGVPQVIDHGRDRAGQLCLVTDLKPGKRLDTLVRDKGPLDENTTLAMAQQILDILKVAHGKDLLHKDITPGNILLDGMQVSLIDWGVSEPLGDGRAPHIRSKREYCAPEYFYYKHCKASDFYSLAWVMVFAMTGRQPYHFDEESDSGYRVVAHVMERPGLSAPVPKEWQPLIENWLSKEPKRRVLDYRFAARGLDNDHFHTTTQEGKDYRQLRREFSFWHLGARLKIEYAKFMYDEKYIKSSTLSHSR